MWHFLTVLICFYGFIKEFKIGEPFIYLYQSEVLNLTREQLTNEVRIVYHSKKLLHFSDNVSKHLLVENFKFLKN